MKNTRGARRQLLSTMLAAAGIGAFCAPSAQAIEFQNSAGTLRGSWDTTISYGQAWRIEDRDCRLIANANGGCGRSANGDDGDINYPQGLQRRREARHRARPRLQECGPVVRGWRCTTST